MSSGLDPDQNRKCCPDRGLNCLQRLSLYHKMTKIAASMCTDIKCDEKPELFLHEPSVFYVVTLCM